MVKKTEAFSAKDLQLIERALLIRKFEETLLSLFSQGALNGTVHTCIGQEWSGIAVAQTLRTDDVVFSNHRGHGHFLARYLEPEKLFAEIMGKAPGVSGGVGGSQHLYAKGFFSSGIQGGMVPIAAGCALAQKENSSGAISVVFIGDGTLGEGILYESLNIISRWELPLLIVVENNGYSQSTASSQTLAGSVEARAKAFNIEFRSYDTWDWKNLLRGASETVSIVRETCRPLVLEIKTYRLKAHSKGDDNRDVAEVKTFAEKDSLSILLRDHVKDLQPLQQRVEEQIAISVEQAATAPLSNFSPKRSSTPQSTTWSKQIFASKRISDLIYETFKGKFRQHAQLQMIGEDIEGPYGGAFKISRDLSQLFPGRVRNTPLSEGAIVGIATGRALAGAPTIVEIMFGDFLTLAFDQLQQHACKFREMFDNKVTVPLIVRTPMGGRRGYGPTHSQSIEKFFLGMPGLEIISLNNRASPAVIYAKLLDSIQNPTLVIENKILYTRSLSVDDIAGFTVLFSDETYPTTKIGPVHGRADVTIVCYGGMLEEAEQALAVLFDEHEIIAEIICPSVLQPLPIAPILESVTVTGRLLTVEEGPDISGFGSEVCAQVLERGIELQAFRRLGNNTLIPASLPAELEILPGAKHIVHAVKEMVHD